MTKADAAAIRDMANMPGWDVMMKEFKRMALTISINSGQSKTDTEVILGAGRTCGIAEMIRKLEKIETGEGSTEG